MTQHTSLLTTEKLLTAIQATNPSIRVKPVLTRWVANKLENLDEATLTKNSLLKKSINRILAKQPKKEYIYYKELMFDSKSDFLRRYYPKDEGINRKIDLYKLYQFAIPKPKIYSKELVKLHFRYYYVKRKLREDTLREILHRMDDSELPRLDLNYLENYTRDRKCIMSECSTSKPSLLKEIGLNPTSGSKKISFGLSVSRILCGADPTMDESLTLLREDVKTPNYMEKSMEEEDLKPEPDIVTFKRDLNFKKPQLPISGSKKQLVKARSGLTEKITARINDRLKQVRKDSKSIYSASLASSKLQKSRNPDTNLDKQYKNTSSRQSLKADTVSHTDHSRSEFTYSDKQFDLKGKQPIKRISIFKTIASTNHKLKKQQTFQKYEAPIDKMLGKVKLQRLNTDPIHLSETETDKINLKETKGHQINRPYLANIEIGNIRSPKRFSLKKMFLDHEFGANSPRYEVHEIIKHTKFMPQVPKGSALHK